MHKRRDRRWAGAAAVLTACALLLGGCATAEPAVSVPSATTATTTTSTTDTVEATTTTTATEPVASAPQRLSITFSVECRTAVAKGNRIAQAVSQDGVILAPTAMELEPGATVYDALQNSGLVVVSQSTALGVYVSAIQSLGVNACGSQSGWLYTVNGQVTGKSCSLYTLQDGDVVRWVYTCDNGKDI